MNEGKLGSRSHSLALSPHFESFKTERVLVIDCKKGRAPVFVKDGNMEQFFIRNGATTLELTGDKMQQYIKQRFK